MAGIIRVRAHTRAGRPVRSFVRRPGAIYGAKRSSILYGKVTTTQVTRRTGFGPVSAKLLRMTNAPAGQGIVAPGVYAQSVAGTRGTNIHRLYRGPQGLGLTGSTQRRIERLARAAKTVGRTP